MPQTPWSGTKIFSFFRMQIIVFWLLDFISAIQRWTMGPLQPFLDHIKQVCLINMITKEFGPICCQMKTRPHWIQIAWNIWQEKLARSLYTTRAYYIIHPPQKAQYLDHFCWIAIHLQTQNPTLHILRPQSIRIKLYGDNGCNGRTMIHAHVKFHPIGRPNIRPFMLRNQVKMIQIHNMNKRAWRMKDWAFFFHRKENW